MVGEEEGTIQSSPTKNRQIVQLMRPSTSSDENQSAARYII